MQALTALRAAFAGMSVQDESSSGGVLECEVVEVKNTCPFRQQSGLSKKGKPRSSYLLRDPGPRQKVCRDTAIAPHPSTPPWLSCRLTRSFLDCRVNDPCSFASCPATVSFLGRLCSPWAHCAFRPVPWCGHCSDFADLLSA